MLWRYDETVTGVVGLQVTEKGGRRATISLTLPEGLFPVPWSKSFGGASFDAGSGIAVDGAGNVIVTGVVTRAVDFGGGPLPHAGSRDIFVAKFAPDGTHIWSKSFGGPDKDDSYEIAVDGQGDVVVTGYIGGPVDFGDGPLPFAGDSDIFVLKFAGDLGTYRWSKSFGGLSDDRGRGLAIDGLGDVVVTGSFMGSADFDGVPLQSAGGNDIFVLKLASDGTHRWLKSFGALDDEWGNGVAVDGQDNILVTGFFEVFGNAVDFGDGPLPNLGFEDIFVAKFWPDGRHFWSNALGGSGFDEGIGITVDGDDNVLVTGFFEGTVDFGGGPRISAGSTDIYVVKLAGGSGNHVWSTRFGDINLDVGLGIAVDPLDNVVVTGNSREMGGVFAEVVRLAGGSGNELWSTRFGGVLGDAGISGVAVDHSGHIVMTGEFGGTVDFGGGPLTSTDDCFFIPTCEIFVVKLTD